MLSLLLAYMNELYICCYSLYFVIISKSARNTHVYVIINFEHLIQATLIIRDLTLCVFAITRFRGKKAVRKLYSNFEVTVYGGGVTVWRAHQLVTSYQYQCEKEC
jgi:hypothetical protein